MTGSAKQGLQLLREACAARAARYVQVLMLMSIWGLGHMNGQIVTVGAGSYTTTLPSGAAAPPTTIYNTAPGAVETHRFWSGKNVNALGFVGGNAQAAYNMIPQPLQSTITAEGIKLGIHGDVQGYNPVTGQTDQNKDDIAFYQYVNLDLTLGTTGLNATSVNVTGESDWTADFGFGPSLTVRLGRGMPFAYALTDGTPVTVSFTNTPTIVSGSGNTIAVSVAEGDNSYTNYYGLFCPSGGNWAQSGNVFTCATPKGSNYASLALLPASNSNTTTIAQQMTDYSAVAFSFPTNTAVSWDYNESSSTVTTTYTVTTMSMDSKSTGFLMALYPHQYDAISAPVNTGYTYWTNHGYMKVNSGTSFTTTDAFHGILPFLPPTTNYDLAKLKALVDAAPAPTVGGDDYAQAKILGKVAQVLPLAELVDQDNFTATKTGLEQVMSKWYTASPTKASTDDSFYYDSKWGALIAYPASFGSDTTLNDHHFHYGYFLHAAAMDGLFDPTWIGSSQYGGMVSLLQQDIANYDRTNTMFPFLRHFDVYAGHSWANGASPFIDGENEESSSEAINAWTGMILLGAATGDVQLRNAGIWLYTQETKGAAYYWFNEKPAWVNPNASGTFPFFFVPLRVANVFDDKGDPATFFGTNPDFEHGIEFLPFTGGSLHLGLSLSYVAANYAEDVAGNAAAKEPAGDWPDLMAEYEALSDPVTALTQWNTVTAATDGETLAHEYAWIMTLSALGQVDASVTANTPFYAVFNNSGTKAHVAFNPTSASLDVTFSDGATLTLPAGTMSSDSALVTPFTFGSGTVTAQPPVAPTGVTATAKSATEIDLSWTLVANVTYSVYRSTTSGFTPSGGNQVASGLSAASYADMGLASSTTYNYVVEAVNSGGNSAPSAQVMAMTEAGSGGGQTVPEANTLYLVEGPTASTPSQLSFSNGAGGVDEIPGNPGNTINTVTNPLIYTVSGVSGTYDSALATAFDFFVDAGTNPGSGVQAEIQFDLDGTGVNVVTQEYAFFATNPIVDFEDYNATARGGLQTTTGTLGNMTNGKVTVKIWNALQGVTLSPVSLTVGDYSGASNVNTPAISNLVIPFNSVTLMLNPATTPTGLTATATSPYATMVSWTASTTPGVSYSLFRSTTSGFTPSTSNLIASQVTTTIYADSNLAASTIYYYVVEAVNALGASAPSAQASVTTPASNGPIPGTNTLYFVGGATATMPSELSFADGKGSADTIMVNNPQSPDVPSNPLVYTMTGVNATYDSTMVTDFNLYVDAGTNVGEAAQVEILYDLDGSGTFTRTELYHFFATDPIVGYELYQQNSRGGLETATGTLGNMTNGTVKVLVWNALPGPNAANMTLSVGNNPSAVSDIIIPFNSVTQNPPGPAAPTAVTAMDKSANEIDLAWTASTTQGVTYNVYRNTTGGFAPAKANLIATVSSTTYPDTTVMGGMTYYYVVASENAAGAGDAPQVSATTSLPTTTALTASSASFVVGGSETLTATVAPAAATGTVTFLDGNATLSTVAVAGGVASYTTSSLGVGTHSITAMYSGDATYSLSVSSVVSISVLPVPPDFGIAVSPSSATVPAGQFVNYGLTLTPLNGFNSTINFSCSGLPALASCTFNPATVTLNGTQSASTTLSIQTAGNGSSATFAPHKDARSGGAFAPLFAAFIPCSFALFCFGRKRRKALRQMLIGGAMLAIVSVFVACGGSSSPKTPGGTSSVTVTATSGSITHTTTVTLIVQ